MNTSLFFANLALALTVTTIAMLYLRRATRKVILELCHTDAGAEFWLRSTDVMAYSGVLLLVVLLGDMSGTDWARSLRTTLSLTLAGLFFTVMFVASNVWTTVRAKHSAPADKWVAP